MCINKMKYSTKQLRIIRFGGVLIFIGTFIFLFIFTGNDRFLKRCVANGNSIKYCNDIYDDRNLAFQKEKKFIEKEFIEKKFDLESKNLLFRGEIYKNGNSYFGQFLNNKPHGFGTLVEANGDKYIGQWENGQRNGQGTYIWGGLRKGYFSFLNQNQKEMEINILVNGKMEKSMVKAPIFGDQIQKKGGKGILVNG